MSELNIAKRIEILLVEDNPGDVRLTVEALKEGKVYNEIHTVKDGVEAMAFLRGEREYAGMNCPDIILLDLNMPKMDGREVLAEIKADRALRKIPVVVLTTSQAERTLSRLMTSMQTATSANRLIWISL